MKIGAGGLQSQLAQDSAPVKKVDVDVQKLAQDMRKFDGSDYKVAIDRQDLFKAVDKLNTAANLYNHNYEFSVREDGKNPMTTLKNKEKDKVVKEITPEETITLAEQAEDGVGLVLNEVV